MEDVSTVYSLEAVNALKQPPANYTASDVKAAREAWLDARTAASQAAADLSNVQLQYSRMASHGRVLAVEQASAALSDAREQEQELEEKFHEILKVAGHLEGIQSSKDQLAQMKRDEEKAALKRSEEAMQAYRAAIEGPYIYNGGTKSDFERVFPALWQEEIKRRTLEGRDLHMEKMVGTGRYPPL